METLAQIVKRITREVHQVAEEPATIKVLKDATRQYVGSNDIPMISFPGEVNGTPIDCVYFDGGRFSPSGFLAGTERQGTAELRTNRAGAPEARVRFRKPEDGSGGPQQGFSQPPPQAPPPQAFPSPPSGYQEPPHPADDVPDFTAPPSQATPPQGVGDYTNLGIAFLTKVTVELLVSLHTELKEAGYNDVGVEELLDVVKGQATSLWIEYNKSGRR